MEVKKKDSTISSMISEYDNVPYMPVNYYQQNQENNRRVFDPSYELRGSVCAQSNTLNNESNVPKNNQQVNNNNKIPRIQYPSQIPEEPKNFYKFPEQEFIAVEFNQQQQQANQGCRRPMSKTRPLESPVNHKSKSKKMGRVPSFFFYFLVFLAEILLFGVLILSLVWVQLYQGGFAWKEDPIKEFNLHPVLMITGFIFLVGHAMLVYRLFGCCNRVGAKLLHTILYLMAVPCIVVATIAVFDRHMLVENPIPNLYSLHSWMGLVTIGLFGLQLIVGFFSFWMLILCEQGTASFRANMLPIHSAFGIITFMLAVATCCTGLTEKAMFSLNQTYQSLPDEAYYYNAMGIALVALAIIMGFILHNAKYPAPSPVAFVDAPASNSHYVMTQHGYVYQEKKI